MADFGAVVRRVLLQKEGVLGLYKGVGPALLRAFPANAACFMGVEFSRSVLDRVEL
jgi:solute carrier family 25 carnitine/acylcarnitine transporter 20/29